MDNSSPRNSSRRTDGPHEGQDPLDSPEPAHDEEAESVPAEPAMSDPAPVQPEAETELEDEGFAEPQEHAEPTLAELLAGTARGDQASFAAFYEETSDVVYGLAMLMHEDAEGAHSSTVAVYHHLWDQADERARDLRLQSQASQVLTDEHSAAGSETGTSADGQNIYRPDEYALVLEWLIPLAHRIMVERFREGLVLPISLSAIPENEGGGIAGLPEEVLEDLETLSDSQTQALALSYLAGGTHQQIAAALGAAVPAVKSRLRDGMTRLHAQQNSRDDELDPILRAAVTKKDVERGTGINRNFTNDVEADLDKGLLTELAEVYALDAVDERDRALLDDAVLNADEQTAHQWDTRVLAARRTLADVFAAHPIVPPGELLDEVLYGLADQEIGMGMVEEFSTHTEETTKKEPLVKRWMIVAGLIVVIALASVIIWRFSSDTDIQAVADADPDARIIEDIELAEGGTARAVISDEEDVAYVDFEDVGMLEGETYQLWVLPRDERPPSSMGNFTSSELEEDIITLRNVSQYNHMILTAEEIQGAERPTGELIAEIPIREYMTEGPQYGGPAGGGSEDEAPAEGEEDGEGEENGEDATAGENPPGDDDEAAGEEDSP